MTKQNKNSLFEQINKIMENPESFRVSDCLPIIIKLEAIIGMQQRALHNIANSNCDGTVYDGGKFLGLFDDYADKIHKKSDKLMNGNGGEDE